MKVVIWAIRSFCGAPNVLAVNYQHYSLNLLTATVITEIVNNAELDQAQVNVLHRCSIFYYNNESNIQLRIIKRKIMNPDLLQNQVDETNSAIDLVVEKRNFKIIIRRKDYD